MQKKDLKPLINQMHQELIAIVDVHKNPTKKQMDTNGN